MMPRATRATPRRVTMFVLNDMRLDSRVRREAATLVSSGYAVTVFAVASEATSHLPREVVDGFEIVRVPMLMRPTTEIAAASGSGAIRRAGFPRAVMATAFLSTRSVLGGSIHFAANWALRWRRWGRRVAELVEPSEVWHAHDFNTLPVAIGCAERFGGAVVYDSHEVFTEAGATSRLPAIVRAFLRRQEARLARRAAAVITVNSSVAQALVERLGLEAPDVVHNCAAAPNGSGAPLRDALGVGARDPIVLYHGSITVGRGLEALVASFEDPRLAGVRLAIMGYGPLRPEIESLAAMSPARDRIHFLPPVPPADVTRWVAGADVAAMPIEPTTLNHRLSSPNKLFEAIAAGVPVVGPDFVEFRRIVMGSEPGPLGRLYGAHGPEPIADAIHSILSLPMPERHALRARCLAAARSRWNWETEALRLAGVYERVLRDAAVPAETPFAADSALAPVPQDLA